MNTSIVISTNAVPDADTTGTDADTTGTDAGTTGTDAVLDAGTTGRAALKLREILGNFKLIQFHK